MSEPLTDVQRSIESNRKIDEVLAHGEAIAVEWLRGAFHTHESWLAHILAEFRELRQLFLANVTRPLTIREAQLLDVCRVCRYRAALGAESSAFVLNYGKEHAHQLCLDMLVNPSVVVSES